LRYLADFAAAYLLKLKATEKEVPSSHRSQSKTMNQREKKTTATKTNRTGIAKFMQLVGGLPALVSKQKNKPLAEIKLTNEPSILNSDCQILMRRIIVQIRLPRHAIYPV
jgi:hypothetical protein